VSRDGDQTKQKLIDAAARLFAQRGADVVSLAEITQAAGQRNTSALHYHFGNREGLLEALLRPHISEIRDRRLDLLAQAESTPPSDLRAPAEAMVRPVAELAQRGWRERAFLHIGAEINATGDRLPPRIQSIFNDTAGFKVHDLLAARLPRLPPAILDERVTTLFMFVSRAVSDRARALEARHRVEPLLSDEEFISNLLDMVVGALSAPVTPSDGCTNNRLITAKTE
jgi:AcrR family transcriptional regulator